MERQAFVPLPGTSRPSTQWPVAWQDLPADTDGLWYAVRSVAAGVPAAGGKTKRKKGARRSEPTPRQDALRSVGTCAPSRIQGMCPANYDSAERGQSREVPS